MKCNTFPNIELETAFSRWLTASYMYYIMNADYSPMTDCQYDSLAKELLNNWDKLEHQHKHLVSKDDLSAGTLFMLNKEDYPRIVVNIANDLERTKGQAYNA